MSNQQSASPSEGKQSQPWNITMPWPDGNGTFAEIVHGNTQDEAIADIIDAMIWTNESFTKDDFDGLLPIDCYLVKDQIGYLLRDAYDIAVEVDDAFLARLKTLELRSDITLPFVCIETIEVSQAVQWATTPAAVRFTFTDATLKDLISIYQRIRGDHRLDANLAFAAIGFEWMAYSDAETDIVDPSGNHLEPAADDAFEIVIDPPYAKIGADGIVSVVFHPKHCDGELYCSNVIDLNVFIQGEQK